MADELRNMMHVAGEAKARQFTAEDFAAVYGHAVFGRVRRRRAVKAVGVGSASVLGVVVIAVGGMNLPRFTAGLGFGSGPSDSVVCTTAGAEQGWVSLVQTEEGRHNAEFADWGVSIEYVGEGLTIVDSQSDGDVTVVAVNPAPSVIYDGGQDFLRQHDDGTYTLPLPGKRVVTLRVIPHEQPDDIEVVTADYRSPTVEVAVGDSGVPAVTCVATPPQPSASASPMPTVSSSSLPEPSTSPDMTATLGQTPFQCGFEFETPNHDGEALKIERLAWLTPDEAESALLEANGGWPMGLPHPEEAVLSASVEFVGGDGPELLDNGERDASDPREKLKSPHPPGRYFYAGVTVVGVSNGVVSATVPPDSPSNAWLYLDSLPESSTFGISMLDDDEALVSCSGRSNWDAVYVVASVGVEDANGWFMEPVYSWAQTPAEP